MWYFSWILGLGFALSVCVLNAIWYDAVEERRDGSDAGENAGYRGAPSSPESPP